MTLVLKSIKNQNLIFGLHIISYRWDLEKRKECGVVAFERLPEPRVTIEWLLAKPRSFSNLPAFLDLYGREIIMRHYLCADIIRDSNRNRRGLEACPQANLSQSVQSATTLFTSPHHKKYTAHFGSFSPVSVKL